MIGAFGVGLVPLNAAGSKVQRHNRFRPDRIGHDSGRGGEVRDEQILRHVVISRFRSRREPRCSSLAFQANPGAGQSRADRGCTAPLRPSVPTMARLPSRPRFESRLFFSLIGPKYSQRRPKFSGEGGAHAVVVLREETEPIVVGGALRVAGVDGDERAAEIRRVLAANRRCRSPPARQPRDRDSSRLPP